jgi:TonB family protein
MRRRTAITLIAVGYLGMFSSRLVLAQQPEAHRKVLTRVAPRYPELARRMNLEGSVKLRVTVAANGSVKSMQAVGGSPLLLKAAQDAIYGWKWAPSSQESQELVELRFSGN